METVTDFIFLGSKITVDSDCNHEIKRHLLFGRKVMANVDSILKSVNHHTTQFEKNKRPNQKLSQRTKQTFIQRRHTDG